MSVMDNSSWLTIQMPGSAAVRLCSRFQTGGNNLVVLLHGLGCSQEAFSGVWDHPAMQSYSLLTYDMLGFGDSDRPRNFTYTLEAQAEILTQILRQFPEYRLHVVGSSFAPAMALLTSEETKARLCSFVAIEPRLVLQDLGNSLQAAKLPFSEFRESFFPTLRDRYRGKRDTAYRLDKALPHAFWDGAVSLVKWVEDGRLIKQFSDLRCPTACVYGKQNEERLAVLAALPPTTIRVAIADSGHFPMIDNPKEFYGELGRFIAQHR